MIEWNQCMLHRVIQVRALTYCTTTSPENAANPSLIVTTSPDSLHLAIPLQRSWTFSCTTFSKLRIDRLENLWPAVRLDSIQNKESTNMPLNAPRRILWRFESEVVNTDLGQPNRGDVHSYLSDLGYRTNNVSQKSESLICTSKGVTRTIGPYFSCHSSILKLNWPFFTTS